MTVSSDPYTQLFNDSELNEQWWNDQKNQLVNANQSLIDKVSNAFNAVTPNKGTIGETLKNYGGSAFYFNLPKLLNLTISMSTDSSAPKFTNTP